MPEAGPYIVMGAAGDRHDFSDDVGGGAELFQNRMQMAGDGAEMAVIQPLLSNGAWAARKSLPE